MLRIAAVCGMDRERAAHVFALPQRHHVGDERFHADHTSARLDDPLHRNTLADVDAKLAQASGECRDVLVQLAVAAQRTVETNQIIGQMQRRQRRCISGASGISKGAPSRLHSGSSRSRLAQESSGRRG